MIESIKITWHINDVKSLAKERYDHSITDEQASEVLAYLEENHDACLGINWDILDEAIFELILQR